MAHQPQPKGSRGWVRMRKTAGQVASGPALDTYYSFPNTIAQPRNPDNLTFMPVVNVSAAPSVVVAGKKTPAVSLPGIPLKASFWSSIFANSLIGGSDAWLDTAFNSDEYAVGVHNGDSLRVYDGCHCAQMALEQAAVGGPILMSLDFLAIYGDSEKGVPTTIVAPTVDPGTLHDVTKVDWNSTAEDVYRWRLVLQRAQGYQMVDDGTLYAASIESGNIGGLLTIWINPKSATIPTTSATLKIGGSGGAAFALDLKRVELVQDVGPSLGMQVITYALFKAAGGYPVAITAIP